MSRYGDAALALGLTAVMVWLMMQTLALGAAARFVPQVTIAVTLAILVVETGANDGLRGIDPEDARANIQAIIDRSREQSPPPALMLVGMAAPPNLGARYTDRFRAIYPDLAQKNGAVLVPFLLDGVAGVPRLNQPDGVHPTAEGQRRLADTVWKHLRPMLAPNS